MGVFKSTRKYNASPEMIDAIALEVCDAIRFEGYETISENLMSGGVDISISKGGVFKSIIGMKTALKVIIRPIGSHTFMAEAGVGIFGQQAVPTAIMLFVAWPIMIPQIWGLIEQSKLDEHVLDLIQTGVNTYQLNQKQPNQKGSMFCPHCGHAVSEGVKFCVECGGKME